MILELMLFAMMAQTPPAADVAAMEPEALNAAIAARDTELFTVMFDRCDPAALADLVTEDLEFYHDKSGVILGREAFVDGYRQGCEAWTDESWRSRRELTAGSMVINPIPGVGAVEEGSHVFYERQGSGPERLVGRARFAVLWRQEVDGQWRLARAFSIDHAAAD